MDCVGLVSCWLYERDRDVVERPVQQRMGYMCTYTHLKNACIGFVLHFPWLALSCSGNVSGVTITLKLHALEVIPLSYPVQGTTMGFNGS